MITDARQIASDTDIQGNIAIIGACAAGITLAVELAKQFRDVLVLESGSLLFEQKTQNLYEGPVLGRDDMDLAGCRLRYFGGSTNHWNGVCAPMDAVNFERVPGRPHSGWPFKLDELVPFYERAYSLCEIGVYQKTPPVLGGAEPKARQILDNREFQIAEFRHSPPTRFGKRYRSDLASSDRIKVYLHANVTNISVSNNGKAISSLDVQTLAFQSAASPGVEIEGDGATSGITQAMNFISEPAPRAPKSSSMTPPFRLLPRRGRENRGLGKATATLFQPPEALHRGKRRQFEFQLRYLSKTSRHGAPVRSRHRIPLITFRLSWGGRSRPRFPGSRSCGNKTLNIRHSTSVRSQRLKATSSNLQP